MSLTARSIQIPLKRADLLALLAYTATLPFMSVFIYRRLGHLIFLSDFVFVVFAAVAALVWLATSRRKLNCGRFEALLGTYLAAMILSAVFSEEPATSWIKVLGVFYLVAIAALAKQVVTSRPRLDAVLSVWLIVAGITALSSLLGVVLFYTGFENQVTRLVTRPFGSLPAGNYARTAGFFLNVNMGCNYLIISTALAWSRWTERPAERRYPLLIVGLGLAAIFTFSIGIGGLVLVIALLSRRSLSATRPIHAAIWPAALAIAGLMLIAATLSPAALVEGKIELSARALTWASAVETFAAHPIQGVGPGLDTARIDLERPAGGVVQLADAHNVWLNIAAQAGLVGFGALLALSIYIFGIGRESAAHDARPTVADKLVWANHYSPLLPIHSALGIGLVGAGLYHGLVGSFEDTRHLWLAVGLMVAARGIWSEE